jgi:hypothetical protein
VRALACLSLFALCRNSDKGIIHLSYAHSVRNAQNQYQFYTRCFDIPIELTVHRALEAQSIIFLEYPDGVGFTPSLRSIAIPTNELPSMWCLLVVEIKNFSGLSFQVALERVLSGEAIYFTSTGASFYSLNWC